MYITKWLAGHPLIAIWVLGIIAILLTWPGIGGDKIQHEHSAVETHPADVQMNERQAINNDVQHNAGHEPQQNKTVAKQTHIVAGKIEPGVLPEETSQLPKDTAPFKSGVQNESIENVQPASHSEVGTVSASKDTTVASTAVDAKKPGALLPEAQTQKSTAVQDLSVMSTEDMLVMAREAYWNNGLEEASEIYIKLIELEPDVLEHKGELGNVYWRQGFPKKAAELYSEVAIPMIKNGDGERVANMIGFIGLFFPDRAAEINRQLQVQRKNVKNKQANPD